MTQLRFDWPEAPPPRGPFLASEANAEARALLAAPHAWPLGRLCLTGPEASGKTHLLSRFAADHGVEVLRAVDAPLGPAPLVVDGADALPRGAEEWMFHMLEAQRGTGAPVLLAARRPPSTWDVALPDLASRLGAVAVARLHDPDPELMAALIEHAFAARQLELSPAVLDALVLHCPPTHAAIRDAVRLLDDIALSSGRAITAHMVRRICRAAQEGEPT
ncbi:MAG: chromosomal replication initiator DnaA [Paracoccaceae bacterium]